MSVGTIRRLTPLTAEKMIERLEQLAAKATPGGWRWSDNGNIVPHAYPHAEWDFEIAAVYSERDDDDAPANAEYILAMHEALPYLLSIAKRVAGAPVVELGAEWRFKATGDLIGKRVALVEIVGGEEG
jgi:hypothetical protein